MATYFWVGGTGTWDGASTTHWAATSGGVAGAGPPTAVDNATFDTNSGLAAATVTITGSAVASAVSIAGPTNKVCTFSLSGNPTFGGALTLNGNSAINRILVQSSSIGAKRTWSIASITSLSNVDFMDIGATGTASNWTGISIGDCGGNTGITFTASSTQTWNGNTTGNWSTAANWTSRVPLPQDNVAINALTSGTITADMPRWGANVDFTGSTGGTLQMSQASPSIFGSLTLASGMSNGTANQAITFSGRSAATLTTKSVTIRFTIIVSPASNLTVGDNVTWNSSLTGRVFVNVLSGPVVGAAFNDGGRTFTTSGVATNAMLNTGGNTDMNVTLTGTWNVGHTGTGTVWSINSAGGAYNFSGVTINLQNTGTNNQTFIGGNATYGTLTIVGGGTGTVTISDSNTFNAFTIGAPKTVTFTAGTTQISQKPSALGTAGNVITLNSSIAGTAWNLIVAGGIVAWDYVTLQDCHASGGAVFYAGAHSTNTSNNTGLIWDTWDGSPGYHHLL